MRKIITYPSVESTNAAAKKLALAGEGECAVAAAEQTAGRGRLARSWQSPAGEGLWVSLLLRPRNIPAERAGGAVFVAALAMAEALCAYGPAKIKWPNDLVMGGKKICGMLAEAGFREGKCDWLVLGAGVNLLQTGFPEELPHATSLYLQTGARVALAVRQAVKGKAREMAAAQKWLTGRLRQSSTSVNVRSIRCLLPTLMTPVWMISRRGLTAHRLKIRRV